MCDIIPAVKSDSWRREVEDLIGRTLVTEARRNETKLAWVRCTGLTISAAFDTALHFAGKLPPSNLFFSGGWAIFAWILVLLLRRGTYQPWFRIAIPIVDAVMLGTIIRNLWLNIYPTQPHIIANLAAFTTVFAVSGGLRLTKFSAAFTTILALALWGTFGFWANIDRRTLLFSGVSLSAAGVLAVWMTTVVRRQVESEVGRAMLERFLPRRVVVDAHENPLALVTAPRSLDVTIVVTDLRGFTAMAETMTPAQVLEFLNRVQGTLAAVVREHEGTVDKFMGDGMLAVFGAPDPKDDHAKRAISAARALRAAAQSLQVRLGIGVHSGPAVVGCIGDGARLEFTVIGDTVNAASRLESLTKERGVDVIVSGETVRRAGVDGLTSLGRAEVRGRKEPLDIYTMS